MKVIFIGAGNLATNLAKKMYEKGFDIIQIYSRTEQSARTLGETINASFTTLPEAVRTDGDLYIFSVKDAVLEEVMRAIPANGGLWVHTAGSIPMSIFEAYSDRHGVFYPLQTFSKTRETDFSVIPFFVEANREEDCELLLKSAAVLSQKVYRADSEQRKYLHLAAVFANNFSNHMYAIAARLVEEHGLPFEALRPLIAETAAKINTLPPVDAQTGPAIRYDENVMEKQINMLDDAQLRAIYREISRSIFEFSKNK